MSADVEPVVGRPAQPAGSWPGCVGVGHGPASGAEFVQHRSGLVGLACSASSS